MSITLKSKQALKRLTRGAGLYEPIKKLLVRSKLYRIDKSIKQALGVASYQMRFPPYGNGVQKTEVRRAIDVVRYGSVALAIHRLQREAVAGAFAEVGVYQGDLSRFIKQLAPDRDLHLFDTFAGFHQSSLPANKVDHRFTDTSVEQVKRRLGDCSRVTFHEGFFPDTAAGVVDETFAFVMLDLDLYQPTRDGLEFFYPRLTRGGYLFVHDYNNNNPHVHSAVDEFLADKPESLIEFPDRCGSVAIRKV